MPFFSDVISRIRSFNSLENPTSSGVLGVLARLRILTVSRSAPASDGRADDPEFVFCALQLGPQSSGLRLRSILDIETGKQLDHLGDGMPLLLRQPAAGISNPVDRKLRQGAVPFGLDPQLIGAPQKSIGHEFFCRNQAGLRKACVASQVGLAAVGGTLEEDIIELLLLFILFVRFSRIAVFFSEAEDHGFTSPLIFSSKVARIPQGFA